MDNTAGSSAASGQRDASSIHEEFDAEITRITGDAGGDWKYLGGVACSGAGDDGPRHGRTGSECSSDPTTLQDVD